jgi:hypothetical protein
MDQEISKCRMLDGVSAKTKFEQLLRRVDEVQKQIGEWQAEGVTAEARLNTEQFVRDNMTVLLQKLEKLAAAQDDFRNKLIRLWFRSDKFLSVLVPAANAAEMFRVNGWKTRRAQQVLVQLVGRLEKLERRGFWRRIWRFICGRRHTDQTDKRRRDYISPTVGR